MRDETWISAWVPLAMLMIAFLELFWKFHFTLRRGKLLLRLGFTPHNFAILAAYLTWVIAMKPYEALWFWNRMLFAITTFLVCIEFLNRLHIREGGISSACFRLRWSEIRSVHWNGHRLKVVPLGKWLHPDSLSWKIPPKKADALLAILRERVPSEKFFEIKERDSVAELHKLAQELLQHETANLSEAPCSEEGERKQSQEGPHD